jgi:hypothetical protein
LESLEKAYHSLSLKIHPDKVDRSRYGIEANEDFIRFNKCKEIILNNDGLEAKALALQSSIQYYVHNAAIGIKIADTGIDILRVINNATQENAWKVGSDALQLYNLNHGFDKYSMGVRFIEIGYQLYQGEYGSVLNTVISTVGFAAAPKVISIVNPWFGIIYSASITGCSAYLLYKNAYRLYEEYSSALENSISVIDEVEDLFMVTPQVQSELSEYWAI